MSVKRNVFVWIVVQLLQVSIGAAAGRLLQEPVSGRDQQPTTSYFSGMVATRDARCQSSEGRG